MAARRASARLAEARRASASHQAMSLLRAGVQMVGRRTRVCENLSRSRLHCTCAQPCLSRTGVARNENEMATALTTLAVICLMPIVLARYVVSWFNGPLGDIASAGRLPQSSLLVSGQSMLSVG